MQARFHDTHIAHSEPGVISFTACSTMSTTSVRIFSVAPFGSRQSYPQDVTLHIQGDVEGFCKEVGEVLAQTGDLSYVRLQLLDDFKAPQFPPFCLTSLPAFRRGGHSTQNDEIKVSCGCFGGPIVHAGMNKDELEFRTLMQSKKGWHVAVVREALQTKITDNGSEDMKHGGAERVENVESA